MRASICMASYKRPILLQNTLASIRRQQVPFEYELIVCDDGSCDNTKVVCENFGAQYHYLDRPYYCNPAKARNVAYRAATGDVIIAQSDDVVHKTDDAIERLCNLSPGTVNIATVWEMGRDGERRSQYTGPKNRRPFFFLGAMLREDLYAIGGDDEDFVDPGFDDDWLAARLTKGRGLHPVFREDVVAEHQWHMRDDAMLAGVVANSRRVYNGKMASANSDPEMFVASGGSWDE